MINGLPPESLTKTAARDSLTAEQLKALPGPDGWGAWSHEATLLAAACDRIDWLIYALIAVNSEKGKGPKEPTPMRRPGVGPSAADAKALRRRQRISAAHLAYVLEHGGAAPPPGWDPGIDD